MTDAETRAELEQIKLHELWDECLRQEPGCEDTFYSDMLDALRLLAKSSLRDRKSQRALREIIEEGFTIEEIREDTWFKNGEYYTPCKVCNTSKQIAQNACKGGSNG